MTERTKRGGKPKKRKRKKGENNTTKRAYDVSVFHASLARQCVAPLARTRLALPLATTIVGAIVGSIGRSVARTGRIAPNGSQLLLVDRLTLTLCEQGRRIRANNR